MGSKYRNGYPHLSPNRLITQSEEAGDTYSKNLPWQPLTVQQQRHMKFMKRLLLTQMVCTNKRMCIVGNVFLALSNVWKTKEKFDLPPHSFVPDIARFDL